MSREWNLLKSGLSSAIGARGFLMVSGFLVGSLLAKTLPDDDLGHLYLLVQIGTVAGLLAFAGTQTSMQRYCGVAANEGDWRYVSQTLKAAAPVQATGLLLVCGVLALVWAPLTTALEIPSGWETWGLACLLALAIGLEELVSSLFRAWRDFRAGNWARGALRQLLLLAFLAWIFFAVKEPLLFMEGAWARVLATGLPALLTLVLALRVLGRRTTDAASSDRPVPRAREIAVTSAPMAVHGLAAHFLGSVDLWTTGYFLGPGPTGVYASVLRVALLLGAFLAVLNAVLPTLLAGMWAESRTQEMERVLRKAATWSGWAAALAFVVLALFGRSILTLAYEPRFADAYPVLLALAGGQLWNVWAGSPGWVLQMTGHQSVLVRITMGTLGLNVALNLLLVREYGMNGVAIATAVGLGVQNLAMVIAARKLVGIRTYAYLNPKLALRS